MTVNLLKLRGRVRNRIRDVDGKAASPSTVEVDMAICDAYIALQADLPQPIIYTASALTISAGSDLFTLPVTVASSGYGTGTVEYGGLVDLQLVSNGQWLDRRTLDELNAFRRGQTSTSASGIPDQFALYEDGSQVVRGRCYPPAKDAQACNMYATLDADDLRDFVGTGGAEGLDTASANLSRLGAAALVSYASAMLVAKMTSKTLELRNINPQAAKLWIDEANMLIYQDFARRNALESNGRTQRRVS